MIKKNLLKFKITCWWGGGEYFPPLKFSMFSCGTTISKLNILLPHFHRGSKPETATLCTVHEHRMCDKCQIWQSHFPEWLTKAGDELKAPIKKPQLPDKLLQKIVLYNLLRSTSTLFG